jgi:hypothetical protein
MSSPQSNVNFPVLPKEIWFKILEICELDSLYPMYWVNKLFQQIMKNMNLLPLFICSVRDIDTCKYSREHLESSTKDFFSHHKSLQKIKHYKLGFLTPKELLYLFEQLNESIFMINMLEICVNIFYPDSFLQILEHVHRFPNITMLSLVNPITNDRKVPEICSKSTALQYLKLRDGILSSPMDFSRYSFVEFSLENMNCPDEISIIMPDCLEKCDLSCYQTMYGFVSNCLTEFHMSHCKKLNTL